jgi:hypothetical protein
MKEEREFFPASEVPWEPVPGLPGQQERILAGDRATPNHSRMLRFEPGTVTSQTLVHDFWEEVWILEGSLRDLRLEETFTAGMYACRPPGMPHGPWESPEGCTTFEVRYADGAGQ